LVRNESRDTQLIAVWVALLTGPDSIDGFAAPLVLDDTAE
jgi:hypothetical protein